jgi:hypothetical protein
MSRHGFESVSGKFARGVVVSPNRVERVDQLSAGRDEARLRSTCLVSRDAAARGALAQSGRADSPERERNAQATRAAIEEWQVESVEVVILDHVRINRLHARHEPAYQIRFRRVVGAVRFQYLRYAAASRTATMKILSTEGSSPVVSRSNCIRRI